MIYIFAYVSTYVTLMLRLIGFVVIIDRRLKSRALVVVAQATTSSSRSPVR